MVLLNSGFTSLLCIGLMFQLYFGLILEFFSGFRVLLKDGLRLKSILGSCLFSRFWEILRVWIRNREMRERSKIFFILFSMIWGVTAFLNLKYNLFIKSFISHIYASISHFCRTDCIHSDYHSKGTYPSIRRIV